MSGRTASRKKRPTTSSCVQTQSPALRQRPFSHTRPESSGAFQTGETGHNFGNISVINRSVEKKGTCATCEKEYKSAEAQQRPVNTSALCPKCKGSSEHRQVQPTWSGLNVAQEINAKTNQTGFSANKGRKERQSILADGMRAFLPQARSSVALSLQPSHENSSTDDVDVYSSNGLLMSMAGSGTCQNGGGSSVCNPTTGKYGITANNNTCCTKDCTQQHEQRHVTDHDGYGCCSALSVAWNKKGANKADLVSKYNTWFSQANLISECNAYTVSVTCADALSKAKDCTGKGKGTDCCKDIADYRQRSAAHAKSNCAKAPAKVPACPSY